jgi:UDP-N-acetylmuramoyl-tripeptide--D-alanyl-D-alanine ligase
VIVLAIVASVALAAAFAAQVARWLRVLQREHYDPRAMIRFLGRWSSPAVGPASAPARVRDRHPVTLSHVLVVVFLVALILHSDAFVVATTIAYGLFAPSGLGLRGRSGPLRLTRRASAIAVVASAIAVGVAVLGAFSTRPWLLAAAVVWAVPMLLDVTTRLLAPYERRQARRYVDAATQRLRSVRPRIVGITGSYGKTSTKNHLSDLLAGTGVVASPASFNNQAGLSRAINENVADGTRVFVAEMGTYGPGEIAGLCAWCPPEVAVVTAIGPVHLERMGSLEVIERAKFEITERASTVVLNVDDARLAAWVSRLAASGKHVVRASARASSDADVVVEAGDTWRVILEGEVLGAFRPPPGVQATNVACALGAALALGLERSDVMARVHALSPVAHRAQVATASSGVVVIDDTFNANPASAEAALALLVAQDLTGRRVVVTPGLIELGALQHGANISLAQKVVARGAELVIVGRTNAAPLQVGAEGRARRVANRDEAVAWVRESLVAGDGVLYLNDLPDHYP